MNEIKKKKGFFYGRKGAHRRFVILALAFPTIHFLVFFVYKNFSSFVLPFQNNVGDWIGWANFKWVFSSFKNNPYLDMSLALKNTLIFFAWGYVELPIALILAYVFFKKMPGNKFFTIILYLPCIISSTVMVAVFKNFIGSDGPIALLWQLMGKQWIYPVTQEGTSIPSMLAYDLWNGYGLTIILYLAAIRRVPNELFESAALDGVTMWQELIYIIVPLIWPMLGTKVILSVTGIFGASGPVLLFTNGEYGTMTVSFSMYLQYKEYGQIARASAIGMLFTVINLPLVFAARWLVGKVGDSYEY